MFSFGATVFLAVTVTTGCRDARHDSESGGLTSAQLRLGIGPIQEPIALTLIDPVLANRGRTLFAVHCMSCHRMESSKVGPELGQVLDRRTPEYVMNMILNPLEMVKLHPTARELAISFPGKYMPKRIKDTTEARALLEYIRAEQTL